MKNTLFGDISSIKKIGRIVACSIMWGQAQSLICDDDDMASVEVANSALEGLLTHAKDVADDFRVGLVTVGAETTVGDEVVGEHVGKVLCLLPSGGLQHHVDFAVLPHLVDIST